MQLMQLRTSRGFARPQLHRVVVAMVGLLFFGTACSSRTANYPALAAVTGTVTFDGQPLANVTVTFQPENGRASLGKTDGNGAYELVFTEVAKGAKVGPHTVSFSQEIDEEDIRATMRPPKHLARTFQIEVTAEPNIHNFDLSDVTPPQR